MNTECEFHAREDGKYECGYCTKVVPKSGIHRNCPEKMKQLNTGSVGNYPAPQPPNLFTRLANFGKAAINHVLEGNPKVTEEVMKERLAICKDCELFKPNDNNVGGICTHSSCGCNIQDNMDYLNKITWADQECPLKKWLKAQPKPPDGV